MSRPEYVYDEQVNSLHVSTHYEAASDELVFDRAVGMHLHLYVLRILHMICMRISFDDTLEVLRRGGAWWWFGGRYSGGGNPDVGYYELRD